MKKNKNQYNYYIPPNYYKNQPITPASTNPGFPDMPVQSVAPQGNATPPKKAHSWIKLIRALLWLISVAGFSIGWGLFERSAMMVHFLNGTSTSMRQCGVILMICRLTLSANGRFAVYWADAGGNSITEEQALSVGEMFERNVARVKELFGMDLVFSPKHEDISDTMRNWLPFIDDWAPLKELSKKEGYEFDTVKQAMPIYIISPGEQSNMSGDGAFYTGVHVLDWLSAASAVVGSNSQLGERSRHTMSIPKPIYN